MKHTRTILMAALMGAMFRAEAGADGAASGSAPAVAGAAPDTNVAEAAKKSRAPKNPDNKLDIVNGRLPLPLVHIIRFGTEGQQNAAVANDFGTSIGKVFDIKKGRNFGYIAKDYKPSAEEVAAAKAWFGMQTAKGSTLEAKGVKVADMIAKIDAMGVATAEEVAARNWQVRTVGQAAPAGEAPVAGAAPAAAAAKPAAATEQTGGAKLF